jgi:mRNA-degrading endonuclease RelE of RelBE toxin-antitoxin system
MRVTYRASFLKDMKAIPRGMLRDELIGALQDLKDADSIEELLTYKTVKKLEGFSRHYRLRVEKYRLGFKHEDDGSLTLVHFKNRGEFYKKFP